MTVLMGGRTAEELVYNEMTTGASDDIERATNLARRMVTEFGMSDELGPIRFGQAEREVFLGRDYGHQANYSEEVATQIDTEIRALVDAAHAEAAAILRAHRATLDVLADHLVEKETLDQSDLAQLLGGLPAWTGAGITGAGGRTSGAPPTPVHAGRSPRSAARSDWSRVSFSMRWSARTSRVARWAVRRAVASAWAASTSARISVSMRLATSSE